MDQSLVSLLPIALIHSPTLPIADLQYLRCRPQFPPPSRDFVQHRLTPQLFAAHQEMSSQWSLRRRPLSKRTFLSSYSEDTIMEFQQTMHDPVDRVSSIN